LLVIQFAPTCTSVKIIGLLLNLYVACLFVWLCSMDVVSSIVAIVC